MTEFQKQLLAFEHQASLPIDIHCTGKTVGQSAIDICFNLHGDLANILFDPPVENHQRTDNLWQRTCFELFVKNDNDPNYWEYNLSPSGNWAIYGFSNYRQGKFDELSIANPVITTNGETHQFTLNCQLPLPAALTGKNLKIGLSAVVQDKNGDIYYYALEHTRKQADFHAAESFTLTITN